MNHGEKMELIKIFGYIIFGVLVMFGMAYICSAAEVAIPSGIYTNEKAYRSDVTDALEALIAGINEIDTEQVVNGTLTDDDWSSSAYGRLGLTKIGDAKNNANNLNKYYIRGANCVASSSGSSDYWYIDTGEMAIIASDTTGAINICVQASATTAVSVDSNLSGGSVAGATYFGYAVDNGSGGYTAKTRTDSYDHDGERLVCTIVMESTGDPPQIDTVTNYTYLYHTAAEDLTDYPKAIKTLDSSGDATTVNNQRLISGWGYINVDSGTNMKSKTVDLSNAGISAMTQPPVVTYIGYNTSAPTAWTDFTDCHAGSSPHWYKTVMNVKAPSATMASAFDVIVARSNNDTSTPTGNNYIPQGYYGFSYMVLGE